MIIKIDGDLTDGTSVSEIIDVCKNICRLTEDFAKRNVVVIADVNGVPVIVMKDWFSKGIEDEFKMNYGAIKNGQQDLVDRRIKEITDQYGC